MKQETITIKGVEYTLQHPGARWYMRATDQNMLPIGVNDQVGLINDYLEHVVVNPKITIDDICKDKGRSKIVEIGEKKYTLLDPGLKVQLTELQNTIQANGVTSSELQAEWILNNVVKEKVSIDDFDYSPNDLVKLVREGKKFLGESESFDTVYELITKVETFLRG